MNVSELWANYFVYLSTANNMSDTFVQRQSLLDTIPSDPPETTISGTFSDTSPAVSSSFLQRIVNSCMSLHEVKYLLCAFRRNSMLTSAIRELSNIFRTSYFETNFASCGHNSLSTALTLMERSGLQIANFLEVGSVLTINKDHLIMKLTKVYVKATSRLIFVHSFDNGSHASNYISLTLHNVGLTDIHEAIHVAFFPLPNMHKLTASKGPRSFSPSDSGNCGPQNEQILLSGIVIVSVSNSHLASVKETIYITFSHRLAVKWKTSPRCVFWNKPEHRWSGRGCRALSSNLSHTLCQCDHLTSFAVLVNVKRGSELVENPTQVILTLIGCFLSIICLTATVATFTYFGNLHSNRTRIHTHLAACLLLGDITFFVANFVEDMYTVCALFTIIQHYLYLCALSWMLQEGLSLFSLFAEPLKLRQLTMTRCRWYFTYVLGYGTPFLLVMPAVWLHRYSYVAAGYCWLNDQNGTIWSFVGPMILVVFFNTCMLVFVIYNMLVHSLSSKAMKNRSRWARYSLWMKGTSMLISLLGMAWIIGVLDVNETTSVFSYLFIIFNSTQGIAIFILHCLFNDKVQIEYHRFLLSINGLPACFKPKPLPVEKDTTSMSRLKRRSIWRKKSTRHSTVLGIEVVEVLRPDAFEMILSGWEPSACLSHTEEISSSSDSGSDTSSSSFEELKQGFFQTIARRLLSKKRDNEDLASQETKYSSGAAAVPAIGNNKSEDRLGIFHYVFGGNKHFESPMEGSSSSTEKSSLSNFFGFLGGRPEHSGDKYGTKARKAGIDENEPVQVTKDEIPKQPGDGKSSIAPATSSKTEKVASSKVSKFSKFKTFIKGKHATEGKAALSLLNRKRIEKSSGHMGEKAKEVKKNETPAGKKGSHQETAVRTATDNGKKEKTKGKKVMKNDLPKTTARNTDFGGSPVDYASPSLPRQFFVDNSDSFTSMLRNENKSVKTGNVLYPSTFYVNKTDSMISNLSTGSKDNTTEPLMVIPAELLLRDSSIAIPHAVQDKSLLFPSSLIVDPEDSFYHDPKGRPEAPLPGTKRPPNSQHTTKNLLEDTVHQAVTDSATDIRFGHFAENQQLQPSNPQAARGKEAPLQQTENLVERIVPLVRADSGVTGQESNLVGMETSLLKQSARNISVTLMDASSAVIGKINPLSAVASTSGGASNHHKSRARHGQHPTSILKGEMHLIDVLAGNPNPKISIGPRVKSRKSKRSDESKKHKTGWIESQRKSQV